jgi:magnesium-transporting ATPase (P-type)
MCTGDNLLTALSVAKECRIIDHRPLYVIDIDEDNDNLLRLTKIENQNARVEERGVHNNGYDAYHETSGQIKVVFHFK